MLIIANPGGTQSTPNPLSVFIFVEAVYVKA